MSPPASRALLEILAEPTFELIPLKDALRQAACLPIGARVSVTASVGRGIEPTVATCEGLQAAGFSAVPHLAARMIRDRRHLGEISARLQSAGVGSAFVVGGDSKEHGDFPDGSSLLRELADIGYPMTDIGIPCYPQGHPFIEEERLLGALREKSAYASYMTTQLCFEPRAIASWLAARRSEGLSLPAHIGVPGVAELHRLLAISARIGVADTRRFLSKNLRFVARLARSGGFFRPNALLEELAPHLLDPGAAIVDLHLYTFNAVEATEDWRRSYLSRLGAGIGVPHGRQI